MLRERVRRSLLPPAKEMIERDLVWWGDGTGLAGWPTPHGDMAANVEKLAKVVEDGNCYGAQQMYKSISARYISAERYSEALDLLHSGACLQLEHGQVTCGAELSVLFVETLVKGKFPYDDDTLDRVRKILKKFPQIPVPQHLDLTDDDDMQKLSEALGEAKIRVEGCSSFLKAAIKWSAEFGAHRNGSLELHDMLAEYIYSESPEVDMTRVSYHFVRGKHPKTFASTLVNFMGKRSSWCEPSLSVTIIALTRWGVRQEGPRWAHKMTTGETRIDVFLPAEPYGSGTLPPGHHPLVMISYPGEDDLAIARAILMYLSLGNLRDANYLMDELKNQVRDKELNLPRSDLMQFINYLLLTLQRDALPLFNVLTQTYKSAIDREPVFYELLEEIAGIFYGVQRRNPMQGMFGDFFKVMECDRPVQSFSTLNDMQRCFQCPVRSALPYKLQKVFSESSNLICRLGRAVQYLKRTVTVIKPSICACIIRKSAVY
ncbi:unnamed protein product [Camellia sinensis]